MENNKNHILIVDDDDRIRNLLKDYLSDNNYIVSTAENAEQAKKRITYLKFAKQHRTPSTGCQRVKHGSRTSWTGHLLTW